MANNCPSIKILCCALFQYWTIIMPGLASNERCTRNATFCWHLIFFSIFSIIIKLSTKKPPKFNTELKLWLLSGVHQAKARPQWRFWIGEHCRLAFSSQTIVYSCSNWRVQKLHVWKMTVSCLLWKGILICIKWTIMTPSWRQPLSKSK